MNLNRFVASLLFASLAAATACDSGIGTVDVGAGVIAIPGLNDPDAGAGNPGDSASIDRAPALPNVTVRFANSSEINAVDVEFFAGEVDPLDVPGTLFQAEFRRNDGIGVGGTGLVPPRTLDTIELSCSAELAFGTLGGAFVDNDTGDSHGRGAPRWMAQQSTGFCGQTVTFVFIDQNGIPATRILIDGIDGVAESSP